MFFLIPGKVIKETTYKVNFHQELNGQPLKDLKGPLRKVFDEVIQAGRGDFQDGSLARMYINAPTLHNAIIVPPRALGEMNADDIMDAVENVLNSDEGIAVSDDFTMQMGIANLERGGARKHMQNIKNDKVSKRSIITIKNDDNMCLARSLAVAIAHLEIEEATTPEAKRTARNRYNVMRKGDQG